MGKEGKVAGHAVATGAEEGVAAVLQVEELGLVGKFVAERFVEPVSERAGGVAGVVETGDSGLAEHGVGIHVVISLIDVMHVGSLLPADIWKANDLRGVQEFFDLIKVGVLIFCIYSHGCAELFHERHLAQCADPFLDFVQILIVVRNNQLELRLFLVLLRRQNVYVD